LTVDAPVFIMSRPPPLVPPMHVPEIPPLIELSCIRQSGSFEKCIPPLPLLLVILTTLSFVKNVPPVIVLLSTWTEPLESAFNPPLKRGPVELDMESYLKPLRTKLRVDTCLAV